MHFVLCLYNLDSLGDGDSRYLAIWIDCRRVNLIRDKECFYKALRLFIYRKKPPKVVMYGTVACNLQCKVDNVIVKYR